MLLYGRRRDARAAAALTQAFALLEHRQGITVLLMLITSLGSTIFWALGASMVRISAPQLGLRRVAGAPAAARHNADALAGWREGWSILP